MVYGVYDRDLVNMEQLHHVELFDPNIDELVKQYKRFKRKNHLRGRYSIYYETGRLYEFESFVSKNAKDMVID